MGFRSRGDEVLPVDLVSRPGVTPLDVSDRSETERLVGEFHPELVLHLAAIASVPRCEDDPDACWRHNIGGTLSVARAASHIGARLVFFSSAAVYGTPKTLPTPVSEPMAPTNLYGISKAAGEFLVRQTCPDSIVLRLFNVYGGACDRSYVIPDVIRKLGAGTPSIELTGTGKETRDFLHITDLLSLIEAARRASPGSVFNAGSGRTITIEELARELSHLMGRGEVVARFSGPRRGDFPINWADTTEPNVPDGWRPRMALSDGLQEMIEAVTSDRASGTRPEDRLSHPGSPGVG